MDARSSYLLALTVVFSVCLPSFGESQTYKADSDNFIVYAPDDRLARQAAQLAEQYRKDLSIDWLGYEIPKWREKCPIYIQLGPHAGGETSFAFVQGQSVRSEPISWQMKIYGPPDRLLDAVLPHEVTHTIFATHFGRPLPRWADEGACTTVEHESERAKNHRMLISFLSGSPSRGIPFNRMFTMKQYPHDILPLYAQGYSVAKYLIGKKGRQHFVKFLEHAMANEQSGHDTRAWDAATEKFYGFDDLSDLQVSWIDWVRKGSQPEAVVQIAASVSSAPSFVDPSATYAVSNSGKTATIPVAEEIDLEARTEEKLNSWYARQSRAKTATDSAGQLSDEIESEPTTGFRPGSLKRAKLDQALFGTSSTIHPCPEGATIWR